MDQGAVLKGSWGLVTRVIIRVTILMTPNKVLITLLTKSHALSSGGGGGLHAETRLNRECFTCTVATTTVTCTVCITTSLALALSVLFVLSPVR